MAFHLPSTTPMFLADVDPAAVLLADRVGDVGQIDQAVAVGLGLDDGLELEQVVAGPAEASAARRAGMSALRMWSTLTSTLFLLPQSVAYLSSHSS